MAIDILLAATGLVLLAVAADHLVIGSSLLARRLRISPVVVGVVVIGAGTSAPEFLVSGLASARGETELAVGNLVGSNIVNLTLLLGVAAMIAPIPVASTVVRREGRLTFAAVTVFGLLAVAGIGRITGVLLAVATVAALSLLVRWARRERPAALPDLPAATGWRPPIQALAGLLGVLAGAQLLVGSAAAIATGLGVSPAVIGFTLVALGTSVPELVTSIQAQRRGESDLVLGNLFGSNLVNSLAGGAIVGLAGTTTAYTTVTMALVMIVTTALALAVSRRGLVVNRVEGVLLAVTYLALGPLLLTA